MFYRNFNNSYLAGLSQVDHILAFTPCWKAHLLDRGLTVPVSVMPHGFAADRFRQVDMGTARRTLNLPEDAFIILNWNRNLVRKRIDIYAMAIARLVTRHPNRPILALANSNKEVGFDVYDILNHEFDALGHTAPGRLDSLKINFGPLDDETVNLVYNAADIGVNTAEGEGFGLCNFEQAGIGKPQVVAAVGGLADIFDDTCAVMIKPRHAYYLDRQTRDSIGGLAEMVSPDDVCAGIEFYMTNPALATVHGNRAMERVKAYAWDASVATLKEALRDRPTANSSA
jgi:hypothetical protein